METLQFSRSTLAIQCDLTFCQKRRDDSKYFAFDSRFPQRCRHRIRLFYRKTLDIETEFQLATIVTTTTTMRRGAARRTPRRSMHFAEKVEVLALLNKYKIQRSGVVLNERA